MRLDEYIFKAKTTEKAIAEKARISRDYTGRDSKIGRCQEDET
jgi:hypothetical protein